ncbi:DUF1329 domain-containing protein [Pseudomonas putida]|uniref:DUF1329 domain-containing protein n=1 Tax=Pseudomonas putida TaxID=303 RepID=UPI0023637906|nr:DUF1329 domain-containing protein [Pseudomonas putida]MDD2068704.1 DUF1329 domain-containing protein [Pseudomonas putida]HDS1738637.1 DUF1329 domain-containing protein [Pseudomonas putida]
MSRMHVLSGALLSVSIMAMAAVEAASYQAPFDPKLTAWAAEMAGNAEGTIPPYTGGVQSPPTVDYATGIRPDPYRGDKVLFWINGKNLNQYADKLSPGVQEMLRKYPTFRLAVFPSRRSVSYPDHVLENTVSNISRCRIEDDGMTLDVSKGCRGGFPFPMPKNGVEVMWNKKSAYMGVARVMANTTYYVKPSGEIVVTNDILNYEDNGLYDPDKPTPAREWGLRTEYAGPTRIAGQATIILDGLDGTRKSWTYQPATRRTRLAPDLAADTPIAEQAGTQLYDQMNMFSGSLDRWDWKLVGKQEMYIPYNVYSLMNPTTEACQPRKGLFMPYHPNPDCVRWELHRVLHVQASLKDGKRHVLQTRDFFFDENSWIGGIQDTYDRNGHLYQVEWAPLWPDYVKKAVIGGSSFPIFDLRTQLYVLPVASRSWAMDKPLPTSRMHSDSLTSFILRPGGY